MKTEIYYFSATGNSLYVARELKKSLSAEIFSIAERIRNQKFDSDAEKIGFVFPQHYYSLPMLVEEFAKKLQIPNVKYFFAIATCGVPYIGRPFTDLNEILAEKELKLSASWYVRLVSNYLLYRDTAADWRIKFRYWLADRKLAKIAKKISKDDLHETWELRKNWSQRMHDAWENRRSELDKRFTCDTEKCVRCGLCERICPVNNIKRPSGFPQWQHNCVECLACLHICSKQAIDCTEATKGRKRYINWNVQVKDLLQMTGGKNYAKN